MNLQASVVKHLESLGLLPAKPTPARLPVIEGELLTLDALQDILGELADAEPVRFDAEGGFAVE